MALPHEKEDHSDQSEFETMEKEMNKHFARTHPHYDEPDWYGNTEQTPNIPAHRMPNTELEAPDDAEDTEGTAD